MSQTTHADLEPMTRDHWLEIVEQSGKLVTEPLIRRQSPRHYTDTVAKLAFDSDGGAGKTRQTMLCSVLDISPTGMMLHSHREVAPSTVVDIEWYEGDAILTLSGRIRHCTGTVGAFKIGVELQFPSSKG